MKNKIFAAIVCIVLAVAMVVPSTLALSADTETGETAPATEAPTTPEAAPATEAPSEPPVPSEQPTQEPTEPGEQPTQEPTAPAEQPTEEPTVPAEQPTEEPTEPPKECTCGAAEGEPHKEGCPLYAPSVEIVHNVEGCTDDCTDEECKCVCHLFKKIMACTTLDEIWALFEEATEEAIAALTDEQNELIDAKIAELEPAPAPAIVIEESTDEIVPSEIVYPTVNYTYVAPFGEPVTGGNQ